MSNIKSVFISYSWDNKAHMSWVRGLADRLANNGLNVFLDQWDVNPGDSLTQFMDDRLPKADFVIVVCTPIYAERSVLRRGGVGYEAQIITSQIVSGSSRSKFIPILRSGSFDVSAQDCGLPPHLGGVLALDMRDDSDSESSFERLLRHLYGEPLIVRPALGERPTFTTKPSNHTIDILPPVARRLPTLDIEHWHLASGVARNDLYPDTFWIPDEATRRTLEPGDIVKLMFECVYEPDSEEAHDDMFEGERMWVEVTGTDGPYFRGLLRNSPICAGDWHELDFGSDITFLPEHVIDVDKGGLENDGARRERDKLIDLIKYAAKTTFPDKKIDSGKVLSLLSAFQTDLHLSNPNEDFEDVWQRVVRRLKPKKRVRQLTEVVIDMQHSACVTDSMSEDAEVAAGQAKN